MTSTIVYVDRSTIAPRALDELRRAISELVARVRAEEPEISAFEVFVAPDAKTMTVIHVHADPGSLARHLDVVEPVLPAFRGLLTLRSIDVYGDPGEKTVGRLQRKARLLGGATLTIHARWAEQSTPGLIGPAS